MDVRIECGAPVALAQLDESSAVSIGERDERRIGLRTAGRVAVAVTLS